MKRGSPVILQWPSVLLTALVLLLSACSLPRIIVLHDPLTTEEHDNLGRIYESQGNNDLALEQYREALRIDKKHLPSLLLLGDLLYRTSDYAGAESAYTKALKIDSTNGDVLNDLAWVSIRTGKNLVQAKEQVSEALTLNPSHRPFYLDTLGVVLLKLGNTTEAITALQEAVNTLPKESADLLAEAEGHLAEARKAAGEEVKK
jgi:tetratricopeptide (TPR) repeat protein